MREVIAFLGVQISRVGREAIGVAEPATEADTQVTASARPRWVQIVIVIGAHRARTSWAVRKVPLSMGRLRSPAASPVFVTAVFLVFAGGDEA